MKTLNQNLEIEALNLEPNQHNSNMDFRATSIINRELQILPRIILLPYAVIVNGLKIPMSRRPVMVKLFETYLKFPLKSFSAEELARYVYLSNHVGDVSQRRRSSLQQNIVKLISRARELANESVNVQNGIWIEWFPYFAEEERWGFYRLSSHYLAAKERQIQTESPNSLH